MRSNAPLLAGAALLLAALLAAWLWTPDKDRAWLEARYLASPGDMATVAGTRLHVRDSGPANAPALVLLHGFGASLHTWDMWAQALAADHRVLRFDLPGSGLSPPDPTGVYTDARSMQLLLALLNQRGIARASVIGHSIGGRLAWTFAALNPERVDRLVLVAPDGFASPGFAYGRAPEVPAALAAMRWVLPRALLRMNLAAAYADPDKTLTPALTTRYHELMLAPGAREALLARMRQTVLVDPRPLLQRIQAPTLLVWGEQDPMIPFANAADYLKAIPHATLVPLPGVGHLPQEEQPARGLAAVREFLNQASRTP